MKGHPNPRDIVVARLRTGKTQTQIANLLHTTYRVVCQWENGVRRMSPALWELLLLKAGQHPEFDLQKKDGGTPFEIPNEYAKAGKADA